ncbi:phosphate regulon transcriptional regulator PhoB [Bartonella tamiae]|uniref:Phosphate regulon transcriptional regulatory protein PhoB n=1 Tax=Bartonella tamiae Th239 TaxID=1094558 RepID=J0R3Q3_9HYPH|nr:phosphate regulon transcriptional regulator PhoB [Bartonella tamiae]EJF90259.1 phosphate regulon transcriptional regulatory protein PhoB [Bartonella tamiae Th239]EJF93800.1 phosphate regulon transcriptional regulatory protein PhoB [Bartonella tamiae Th307]
MSHKPTITVVEDEEALITLLRYNLENEGYFVRTIGDGEDADYELKENIPDLLILDWMLPGLSGIELCRRLRTRPATKKLPIIMLTARGEEDERIRGLNVGADDFIVKPFSMPELLARIHALLRRANPDLLADSLQADGLILDRHKHKVFRGDEELHLGPTEFKLLEFFMRAPGRVFSRAQLLDNVWGSDNFVDDRTVDVHIRRLRLAINHGDVDLIRTVRGAGYAFG